VAVAAHVMDLRQLLGLGARLEAPSLAVAFIAIDGVWVDILVGLLCCEFCNSLCEGLDQHQHRIKLGVLCLCVGCMVVVGRRHTCYLGDLVMDFVATVRKLVCRLVLVWPVVLPPAFCSYVLVAFTSASKYCLASM
jgi:hypothetical protein